MNDEFMIWWFGEILLYWKNDYIDDEVIMLIDECIELCWVDYVDNDMNIVL